MELKEYRYLLIALVVLLSSMSYMLVDYSQKNSVLKDTVQNLTDKNQQLRESKVAGYAERQAQIDAVSRERNHFQQENVIYQCVFSRIALVSEINNTALRAFMQACNYDLLLELSRARAEVPPE